jgi:hypothetical protein
MEHAHPSYAHIGLQKSHTPWVTFEENPVNKNQGWEEPIHQKYKANENTSRHILHHARWMAWCKMDGICRKHIFVIFLSSSQIIVVGYVLNIHMHLYQCWKGIWIIMLELRVPVNLNLKSKSNPRTTLGP